MHCGSIIVLATLFASNLCLAQHTLQIVSSTPLAKEVRTQFWTSDLRVGCTQDGNTLLALKTGGT